MTVPTRRERLRSATVSEIKDGARRLLVAGGPQAVSLRAIARAMGMTAPAIYRYFPGLDALVGALAGDLYDELRIHVQAARDSAGDDPVGQLAEMARAYRRWSVEHPAEFALIFGRAAPGPAERMAELAGDRAGEGHAGARLGAVFLQPFVELWQRTPFRTPPRELIERRLGGCLELPAPGHGRLPIEVAYVFLSGWARLYGLVSMEVFNQLRWAVTEPRALFETELTIFLDQLSPDTGHPLPVPDAGHPLPDEASGH